MQYSEQQLEQAITWFVRLQAESCSEQDRQAFQHWRAKNPNHSLAYQTAEQLWGQLDELKTLGELPALKQARRAKPAKTRSASLISALVLTVLLAGGYAEYHAPTLRYRTALGQRQHFVLADNSEVDLNTNTELQVRVSWLQREVKLVQGEAFFNVKHQAWRAFEVQAGELQIRDIGTRFNVRLQSKQVDVAVLEGEVELSDGHNVPQRLLAGTRQTYTDKGLGQKERLSTNNPSAWLEGQLVFKNASLRTVTDELARYHAVQFVFAPPELANETLSGSFASSDLEPFLHSLQSMFAVQVKHQGKQIMLQHRQKK